MSRDVRESEDFSIVSFWGGNERGRCYQITTENHRYIQLTVDQTRDLLKDLTKDLGAQI